MSIMNDFSVLTQYQKIDYSIIALIIWVLNNDFFYREEKNE